jgi:DNA polymerase III sliding clamp (beta) subunit (PCNA family)
MKIEVAKIDLESALAVSTLTVGSGTDLSSHYLFRKTDAGVEILSYDMRTFSGIPLKCVAEGEDSFTVEAWRLDKWLSGVADGVLTITSDANGEVTAKGTKGRIRLRSLDPSKFPYGDRLYSDAKVDGTIVPSTLNRAINVSKCFVSTDDTQKPEICQIEAINGTLWSTDRRALSHVRVAMPELNMRIPGKDIPTITKFLSLKDTLNGDVTLLTSERSANDGGGACAFIRRADGGYIGVSRPNAPFPKLDVNPENNDESSFVLDLVDFKSAVSVLSASAPKNHETIRLRYLDGRVVASMPSDAGGEDDYPLTVKGDIVNGDAFADGFTVGHNYLKSIADAFGVAELKLGVNRRGKGGFIGVRHKDPVESGATDYFAVLVWKN